MKKILCVEDGSVDIDDLKKRFGGEHVLVYRQGTTPPVALEIETSSEIKLIHNNAILHSALTQACDYLKKYCVLDEPLKKDFSCGWFIEQAEKILGKYMD